MHSSGTTPVVYDINVIVNAAPAKGGDPLSWPSLPPRTSNSPADAIGAINAHRGYALWLSPHVLKNARRIMTDIKGYDRAEVDRYLEVVTEIAHASGGGVVDPPRTVHVNRDHEDNLILDLAAHVDALLIVSADKDLLDMPLWHGTPVLHPRDFAGRVDASWRRQPKNTEPSTTDLIRRRIQKEIAERTRDHQADFALAPGTPDSYRRLRIRLDANCARLDEIVSGWNAENPAMKPRIAQWAKNLEIAATRAAEIDTVSATSPDTAQDALTTLNARLETALDRMDPRRMQPADVAKSQRPRPVTSTRPDELHRTDQQQFGA